MRYATWCRRISCYMKIVNSILLFVVMFVVYVVFIELRVSPSTRVFSETIYECDYKISEIMTNTTLLSSVFIGFYWHEFASSINQDDDLSEMVEALNSMHDGDRTRCNEIVIAKLNKIKQLGFDFSAHKDQKNRPLIFGAVLLQNKEMVEWLLKNGGYTDFKVQSVDSEYHGMNLPYLAGTLDLKFGNQVSLYIKKEVELAHTEYEKLNVPEPTKI